MPVPTETTTEAGPSAQPSERKQQKQMTKAERRELQEKQRAAKQAQKSAAGGQAGGSAQGGQNQAKTSQKPAGGQPKATPQGGPSQASSNRPRSMSIKDVNAQGAMTDAEHDRPVSRGLRIFHHFGLPKYIHSIKGDIHPAIIRLGLLFSEFKICGSNARCIATLTAFKTVIQDYTTPPHNTLSRHLMTHLSPQITYLVAARPMSVTMGNAIRQLKLEISNSDIDMVEQDAKNELCSKIDTYIRERIIAADEVIQELAGRKIKDHDVVLTYARSSIVEKILLGAAEDGVDFSVIVIDSRPLLEGRKLLKTLIDAEIPCTYALLSALPSLITEVSTVLIGAHSLNANGSVYSRAGTALVTMMAKAHSVPVMVCCETYKFSEGVMLDGFGKNELVPSRLTKSSGNPPELVPNANLEVLNPLYDLTPPACITAVVTEVGLIPPSSISSIPLALGKTSL